MAETIYTLEEVMELLNVRQKRTIYNWLRDGRIEGFRVGRQWRFTQAQVDDYISRNTGGSGKEARPPKEGTAAK